MCLGLTRLSGGILFGTMILLSTGSIAGLITSIVLYVQGSFILILFVSVSIFPSLSLDVNTDPQWKILGMVVCAIMLLTVLVTLCIFIYCYKKGHIKNSKNRTRDVFTPSYHHDNDYPQPYNHHRSPMPYGRMGNVSANSYDEDVVQVQDKLTNTEMTNAPLRPRDIQRGVWQGRNAYNGYAHRPIYPPRMTNRVIQALPHEIDQGHTKARVHPAMDTVPQTIVRLPEKRPRRVQEVEPVEEVVRRPRRRGSDEYVEIVRMPKKDSQSSRFKRVSVKHVKPKEEAEDVDEDYPTDHFYQ